MSREKLGGHAYLLIGDLHFEFVSVVLASTRPCGI